MDVRLMYLLLMMSTCERPMPMPVPVSELHAR